MLFAEFNVQPEKCMSGALNTNTPNRIRGVYFPSLTKSSILPPRDLKKAASGERSIRFGAAFVMRRSSGRTGSVTKSLDQETATDMSHASPSEGNSNVCGPFRMGSWKKSRFQWGVNNLTKCELIDTSAKSPFWAEKTRFSRLLRPQRCIFQVERWKLNVCRVALERLPIRTRSKSLKSQSE